MEPLISVVIPTYNRFFSTLTAIHSALAQSYPAIEIVVIDDGSTDGSGEKLSAIVEELTFAQRSSRTLTYFRQDNQGPAAARNTGIDQAHGQYIAFLDSDDIWFDRKLELQLHTIEQYRGQVGACFTDAQCVDHNGMNVGSFQLFNRRYPRQAGIDQLAAQSLAQSFCGFWISTLLARRDVLTKIGGFRANLKFAEDRDLFFRLSLATPLAYVNMPLARCDRSASPAGAHCRPWENIEVRLLAHLCMYEDWLEHDSLPVAIRSTIIRNKRAVHCQWANWHLENGRYREAQRELSQALSYGLAPKVLAKWALTGMAPSLTRRMSQKSQPYLYS